MAITFEVNQIPDREVKEKVEQVIQDFIGSRRKEGDWRIWIYASTAIPSNYFQVILKGPTQGRERMFFENIKHLDRALSEWLSLYPLH
jgi:hypothetical protein